MTCCSAALWPGGGGPSRTRALPDTDPCRSRPVTSPLRFQNISMMGCQSPVRARVQLTGPLLGICARVRRRSRRLKPFREALVSRPLRVSC